MDNKPMTAEEAAKFLSVSLRTIYNTKNLPRSRKFGRTYFKREDLVAFVEGKGVSHE